LRKRTRHGTADSASSNEITEENLNEKTMFKNYMGFNKLKNVNISIKLHFFVLYIVLGMSTGLQTNNHNALTHVIQVVCNPVDIPRTITHKRMQFNA